MRKQRGVTLTGFIVWAVIFFFAVAFAFKVGPAYVEFYTIKKLLKNIANDPESRSGARGVIERSFSLRGSVEDIKSVQPHDLQISKEADGIVISADYSVRVPLVGNMSACLDFHASSEE